MKRNKILFIGEINKPIANANGICIETLAEELSVEHDCYISSYLVRNTKATEIINRVVYKRVKPTLFYRMREKSRVGKTTPSKELLYKISLIFNKIKKMIFLPLYPITSIGFILKYYIFLDKLHQEEKFDIIVSQYFPIDSLLAGYLLKLKYPKIKHAQYLVDTLSNGATVKFLPDEWVRKKTLKWENFLISKSDLSLVLLSHKLHYMSKQFEENIEKIKFTDIPLFKPKTQQDTTVTTDTYQTKFIYSGSLVPNLRSPIGALDILLNLVNIDTQIEFYTQGGYEEYLKKMSKKDNFSSYGFINHELLLEKIEKMDILVSIGNSHSDMIPSKTFEYISTGKPIIHFYDNDKDASIPYLEKYGNCLLVDTRNTQKSNIKKVELYLGEKPCRIDMTLKSKAFEMNSPQYTTNILLSLLKKQVQEQEH